MARLICRTFMRISEIASQKQCVISGYINNALPYSSFLPRVPFHTSNCQQDLNEFFDTKENWGESKIKTGRPWKPDELRIKSNSDLHKLWYVLLKERNMLMTMEAEYKNQGEVFPNPERFEKVEESMENVLEVVAERDRAYNLLETGTTGEPQQRWTFNELGVGFWRTETEHYLPEDATARGQPLSGTWQNRFLRLYREKVLLRKEKQERKRRRWERVQRERDEAGQV